MNNITISKDYYEKIRKYPLIFFKKKRDFDNHGNPYGGYYWCLINEDIKCRENLYGNNDYCLCIIENAYFIEKDPDNVNMIFHIATLNDLRLIIEFSLSRTDRYSYMELLWLLNCFNFSFDDLNNAINNIDDKLKPAIMTFLNRIGRCLSISKQNVIEQLFNSQNLPPYQIYFPQELKSAIQSVQGEKTTIEDNNLFKNIDYLMKSSQLRDDLESNFFVMSWKWLNDDQYTLSDYSKIVNLYALVSDSDRLRIVRRYFHDIRLKRIPVDTTIISHFINNPFEDFIRYRYCIESPGDPIKIEVPILCDSILTLINSNGKTLQTINGLIDYAVTHSNVISSQINWSLKRILPICQNGLFTNPHFKGFIDCEKIFDLNIFEVKDSDLVMSIIEELDQLNMPNKKESNDSYQRWRIPYEYDNVMRFYFNKSTVEVKNIIDIEDSNTLLYFRKAINKIWRTNNEEIYIEIEKVYDKIFKDFAKCIKVKITPQKNIIDGMIDGKGGKEITAETILTLLKNDLPNEYFNGDYFEIPFDEKVLNELYSKYLYVDTNDLYVDKKKEANYLTTNKYAQSRSLYCSPRLNTTNDFILGKPFFWCAGISCFRNNLNNQTLEKCNNWRDYTLFHIAEIIGYPLLHETSIGYEPEICVWNFKSIVSKAKNIFNSLKCESCGHLLFPHGDNQYNRHHYYSCINPICKERQIPIYLNYCFNCKNGLIDSRKTKRCDNGWYICPNCLHCCDDNQINLIVQRFTVSNNPIPSRIKSMIGKGHNNNGIYYCPYCGKQISIGNRKPKKCPYCMEKFIDDSLKKYNIKFK